MHRLDPLSSRSIFKCIAKHNTESNPKQLALHHIVKLIISYNLLSRVLKINSQKQNRLY